MRSFRPVRPDGPQNGAECKDILYIYLLKWKKGKKRDMTTKIILKAMRFYAYHGVAPQERKVGNTFMVDLELTAPLEAAVESDRLEDTINYAEVYATVRQEMQIPSQLLEHAAGRIVKSLHHRFPQLEAVEITLSKLNPPFGGDLESASVSLRMDYK